VSIQEGRSRVAQVEIPFQLRGLDGVVHVTVERNVEPELVGSASQARDFPWCDATVDYPARGYGSVLGWVQLVRSDDNASGGREFEIDPLEFVGDVPHPFCLIGLEPHLFDASSRGLPLTLDWLAHSWLCVPDGSPASGMTVQTVCGFSWGFRADGTRITLVPPAPLPAAAWDSDASSLAPHYPAWRFVAGFRSD
jgi:hypothetical protein